MQIGTSQCAVWHCASLTSCTARRGSPHLELTDVPPRCFPLLLDLAELLAHRLGTSLHADGRRPPCVKLCTPSPWALARTWADMGLASRCARARALPCDSLNAPGPLTPRATVLTAVDVPAAPERPYMLLLGTPAAAGTVDDRGRAARRASSGSPSMHGIKGLPSSRWKRWNATSRGGAPS